MAPWDSPAVLKKGETFTAGADDYQWLLAGEIILRVEKTGQSSGMARDRRVLADWPIRPVRYLPDG